jgi:hypothetical protein
MEGCSLEIRIQGSNTTDTSLQDVIFQFLFAQ